MNPLITVVCVLATLAVPLTARAQSCASVLTTMQSKWQSNQLKTTFTMVSHQANGLSAYSGTHAAVAGAPQYEARLVWNGNWMTSVGVGGVRGKLQFGDRVNTAIYPADKQNFSVDPPQMEAIDIYVSASYIFINNTTWGNWIVIPNPRCENGVMWGLGDPIGNANAGRKAVYVFSYGFAAQ